MTEAEWRLGNNPEAMFTLLAGRGTARRWRLFVSGCLRELGHLLPDQGARRAFLTVQRAADGLAGVEELKQAHADAVATSRYLFSSRFPRSSVDRRIFARMHGVTQALLSATLPETDAEAQAIRVASTLRHADAHDRTWEKRIGVMIGELLRDLFGDPFRQIVVPARWLCQQGRQAVSIAATIYDDRTFDELPILADALEDTGCPVDELIRHCRESGPHGRGCWAVDALLVP
jgi:hypothetical protein